MRGQTRDVMRGMICGLMLLYLLAGIVSGRALADPLPDPLPESYHGLWAWPHCRAPAEVLLYDSSHLLQATARQASMSTLAVQARADTYLRVRAGDTLYFLERAGARLNRIGLALPNGVWPEKLDPHNPALRVRSYEQCAQIPAPWPSLNEDGLVLFRCVLRMAEACNDEDSCWHLPFAAADRNGDDVLDYSELARFWRGLAYLAGLQDQCAFHEIFPGDTAQAGAHFALAAVRVADGDGDLRLSLAEIRNNAAAILDDDSFGPVLRGRLAVLRPFLPLLPDPACTDAEKCRPCGRHD